MGQGVPDPGRQQPRSSAFFCEFDVSRGKPHAFEWMFADAVVPIEPSDEQYDSYYAWQAIQVFPSGRHYREPPFQLNHEFRLAFVHATGDFGVEKMMRLRDLTPPLRLLNRVAARLRT